jgi:hypothetical protein
MLSDDELAAILKRLDNWPHQLSTVDIFALLGHISALKQQVAGADRLAEAAQPISLAIQRARAAMFGLNDFPASQVEPFDRALTDYTNTKALVK